MDLIKSIKNVKKIVRLLKMIEVSEEGDVLISAPKSLLIETDYLVISTERKSKEHLKEIKEAYDNTKDGVMCRASGIKINTNKETWGCNTR